MTALFVILSLIDVAACVFTGASKLSGQKQMVEAAEHLGIPWERFRLIGLAEVLAAVGLLIGLFWTPLGVLAAIGMLIVTIGALYFHSRLHDSLGTMTPPIVVAVVNVLVLITAAAK